MVIILNELDIFRNPNTENSKNYMKLLYSL